jgi:histidine triad (HIT) family protein
MKSISVKELLTQRTASFLPAASVSFRTGRAQGSMEKSCTFCQIIGGEKPTEFLYQDDTLVVFKDIRPHAPVHLLIVPKRHIRSLNDLKDQDKMIVAEMILRAQKIAKEQKISDSGYKILFNVERGGGQVIFHLHMHLLGGW